MTKYEFMYRLDKELTNAKIPDKEQIMAYYEEMIQDAKESGSFEEQFIQELGSVEKIVRHLQKDGTFTEKIRRNEVIKLRVVVSTGIRLIGIAISAFVLFILAVLAFSLMASGIGLIAQAVFELFRGSSTSTSIIYHIGIIFIGTGIVFGGYLWMRCLFSKSREIADRIIEWVNQWFPKEENK